MNHLTIATSSGIVWLTLVTHFGAALLALLAGTIALAVAKGGRLHKQSGMVFTWAMITTGILASVLSAYEGKSVVGGLFVCYLVFTATTTVKPSPRVNSSSASRGSFRLRVACFPWSWFSAYHRVSSYCTGCGASVCDGV